MRHSILILSISVHLLAGPLGAVEDWADPALPVTRGLDVWLDAARENEARRRGGVPDAAPGQPLDRWLDASGAKRDVRQDVVESRPTFVSIDGHPAVRFDGKKQHFVWTGAGEPMAESTIFIAAVPFSNHGAFRAFLALNRKGENDYTSGLTLDMGPMPSERLQSFNPEGAGFGGARNVLKSALDFGVVARFCLTTTAAPGGTKLYLNGKLEGARDRQDSLLATDQLTVGARCYGHGVPPQITGFLEGDIAEVLIYRRVLGDDERASVDRYLAAKHVEGRKVPVPRTPADGKPLVRVAKPPSVQVLVPGFAARALPVDLTNINNVAYRQDGKLVALAYSGDIYLLSDADGDGLEEKVETFWEGKDGLRAPIGMALTPPGYAHGDGVLVTAKGKCALIADTDRDGKGDREITVATGWKELSHGVDALGAAFDPRDGSVYFGIGCTDFTNAYVLKDGKSGYRLESERGTILRVAPDFKSREVVATGIRFPVGLRFNEAGDLFATDQEGATWLPNGNPGDELLHIEKGRHYGFPPRHPRHLPNVIDEPSVFDYMPQHESTCGLNFNEPVAADGPVFGPPWWKSDLFVAGYSRGKLYQTRLVKSAGGYVAWSRILAVIDMLPVDACVSPKGHLVIAAHGGGPDWGDGPQGKGKLFQVRHAEAYLPQPVLAWPQGPGEVYIAFDRSLKSEHVVLPSKATIEFGKYVAAGDRFESLRPGYQVVHDQLMTPRFDLPVFGVRLVGDSTLSLATAPHPEAASYAVTLGGMGRPPRSEGDAVAQVPETDIAYDLSGAEASWRAGQDSWSGWLPHLDLQVARELTQTSATHDDLWTNVIDPQQEPWPGKLTLRTKLDLWEALRPAVQPGARIDYEWPEERVTLVFRTSCILQVRAAGDLLPIQEEAGGTRTAQLTVVPKEGEPVPVEVTLGTGKESANLTVTFHTQEDARPRALPLRRLILPWAALRREPAAAKARVIPELEGGNWSRGRTVYFGAEAACSRCHEAGSGSQRVGPDLSNLPHRDYASVLRDITQPSFAIHPDHIAQVVSLSDGRALVGAVRTDGDRVHIADAQGQVTTVGRNEIASLFPSGKSIMPDGLLDKIGSEKLRDLMTFLLLEGPRMPDYGPDAPPPPRSRKEVEAVLAGAPEATPRRPIHVALVAGRKDHGPGEHDYPAWLKAWSRLLSLSEDLKVTEAMDWPSPEDLRTADVLIFFQQGSWSPERARDIDGFLARGGGLVYLHYAVDGGNDPAGFARRIGLAWQGGRSKFRHGPVDLVFTDGARHPIARNFERVQFVDESYWDLVGSPGEIAVMATCVDDGAPRPILWTLEPSGGRVFVSILGHYAWTFDDPFFRALLLRGIAWAAREPVDRFNDLVLPGARVSE